MAAPLGAAVCLEGWCIFLKHPPSAYASARTSNLNASAGIVVHASRPSRISSPNPLQATEQNVIPFCSLAGTPLLVETAPFPVNWCLAAFEFTATLAPCQPLSCQNISHRIQ